jgi:hypothetical protein
MKWNRLLFNLHRIISWTLLPVLVITVLSGYAYTRKVGVFRRGVAYDLHNVVDLPFLLLLVAHVVLAARFELMRFKIKGKSVDIMLLVLGIAAGLSILYVDMRIPR